MLLGYVWRNSSQEQARERTKLAYITLGLSIVVSKLTIGHK